MVLPAHLIPCPLPLKGEGELKPLAGGLPFSFKEKGRGVEVRGSGILSV